MINKNNHLGPFTNRNDLKQLLWVAVLPMCLALLVCTIPLEAAFAQNASQSSSQKSSGTNVKGSSASNTGSNNSNSSAKNQTATTSTNNKSAMNKTVVKVAPGSAATITTTGNKTTVTAAASTPTKSNSGNNPAFNRTGFTNLYVLTINGKIFPVKYDIKGGKLVGILADTDRSTLVLVLNPGTNGGNVTVELPRNIIDSKGASNSDTKYQIKIDGKGVDYKEVANNAYARVLSINFSKDNRFMEIIGTKMVS